MQGMMEPGRGLRILVVAQAYSPVPGSHAARVTELVRGLARRGCMVHVLASTVPGATRENEEDQKLGVVVHRGFVGPFHSLVYALRGGVSSGVHAEGNSLVRRLSIPDTFIEWLPGAVIQGITHCVRCWRPDVVVSSAVPYTAHLVAGIITRVIRVPWVADYGDPWVFDPGHPRGGLRFLIEHSMENWVTRHADAIVVTTPATKELYLDRYPGLTAGKVHVVPCGYNEQMFDETIELQSEPEATLSDGEESDPKLRLLYAGSIRRESRNPEPFLRAIVQVNHDALTNRVQFRVLGSVDRTTYALMQDPELMRSVELIAWAEKSRVFREMHNADVLVLFGNNNHLQTPGKLFEYIGSGVPILYLKDHSVRGDDCERYLERSGRTYWIVHNSQRDIEEWLSYALSNLTSIRALKRVGESPAEDWSWGARAGALLEVLQRVVECAWLR